MRWPFIRIFAGEKCMGFENWQFRQRLQTATQKSSRRLQAVPMSKVHAHLHVWTIRLREVEITIFCNDLVYRPSIGAEAADRTTDELIFKSRFSPQISGVPGSD
jgi:hypothetical protein